MSYISIARKYRPKTFADLIGQESTTVALSNAVDLGREPQGLIFSGVRGVGKTTLARLYCKALNCSTGPTSSPCEQCEDCLLIDQGRHEDVLEIDGASNTGVDDIRLLQETLGYVPQRSQYKIYIIDEVHMLSQSAFNALLKTLEEPPAFVVFVLATTELGKIPDTILSRCQVFRLRRLGLFEIQTRVRQIIQSEGIAFDEEAVRIIAKEGNGSMRDALTFLDQSIAFSGGKLSAAEVSKFYATSTFEEVIGFLQALLEKDVVTIVDIVGGWDFRGLSFKRTLEDAARVCRHATILQELGIKSLDSQMLDLTTDEITQISSLFCKARVLDFNRLFRTLLHCSRDLDGSVFDRFIVENFSLEWCLDPGMPFDKAGGPDAPPLLAGKNPPVSKSNLGKTVSNMRSRFSKVVSQKELDKTQQSEFEKSAPVMEEQERNSFPKDWQSLVEKWKRKKPFQARILEEAFLVSFQPDAIQLEVEPNSLAAGKLLQNTVRQKIEAEFEVLFGFQGKIHVRMRVGNKDQSDSKQDSILLKKQREKKASQKRIESELIAHPVTQEVLRVFDGEIDSESVKLN